MDDYPEHLAPQIAESGAVATPFAEWWARVRPDYPHVPEEVARYWLHEHWGHSPYRALRSADYRFKLVDWPAERFDEIRSCWNDYAEGNAGCRSHGKGMIRAHENETPLRTPGYMLEHGDFPTPIIVLDNRDGHLQAHGQGRRYEHGLTSTYVLIEGHRRFNLALALHEAGKLKPSVRVWLMERAKD